MADADSNDWIVLLEGRPLSAFKQQYGPRAELNESQKNMVRGQMRLLDIEQSSFLAAARRQGLNLIVQRSYSYLLNGLAVSIPMGEVERLTALRGVRAIYPDRQVHLELADSVQMIGADDVWQMLDSNQVTVTGQGVRVAVVDTGIDYTHPDLGGCFGPGCKVVGGYDLYNLDNDPRDDNGHGTHCAGIVAADGSLKGVAPGASLYAYKVLSAAGTGSVSVIIAGIEQAADPDQDPTTNDSVDIISMSLGVPGTPDDPWSLAVDAAVQQGIIVAVSAGNSGPDYASMEAPGLARGSIAVGAVDKSDMIAAFSSRGPVPGYEELLKPDLLAPGVDIVSTYLDGTYASSSGTSMAAPHVAGAAALIKQMHAAWTADQIQANLMNAALDLGLNLYTQGAGRLQVHRAVLMPGLVTPAKASFGAVNLSQPRWSDTRLFWLENISETVRSYRIYAETLLPDSVSVMVEPDSLTLQPGEKRSFLATLTVDPLQTPPDLERNEGSIRIQQGEVVLRVPFAFTMPPIYGDSRILPFDLQTSYAVALHDLDGDGDLDAFIGNTSYYDNPANTVWLNVGAGNFTDTGQRL
ncbi:MAG: S8 family serine peptidase, partial [Anaerolineales bacterium]